MNNELIKKNKKFLNQYFKKLSWEKFYKEKRSWDAPKPTSPMSASPYVFGDYAINETDRGLLIKFKTYDNKRIGYTRNFLQRLGFDVILNTIDEFDDRRGISTSYQDPITRERRTTSATSSYTYIEIYDDIDIKECLDK